MAGGGGRLSTYSPELSASFVAPSLRRERLPEPGAQAHPLHGARGDFFISRPKPSKTFWLGAGGRFEAPRIRKVPLTWAGSFFIHYFLGGFSSFCFKIYTQKNKTKHILDLLSSPSPSWGRSWCFWLKLSHPCLGLHGHGPCQACGAHGDAFLPDPGGLVRWGTPGVDSNHSFSTIVLFKNRSLFPWVSDGFLERRIPGKNGEVSSRGMTFRVLGLNRFLEKGSHGGWFRGGGSIFHSLLVTVRFLFVVLVFQLERGQLLVPSDFPMYRPPFSADLHLPPLCWTGTGLVAGEVGSAGEVVWPGAEL